jgi:hypothetical protein
MAKVEILYFRQSRIKKREAKPFGGTEKLNYGKSEIDVFHYNRDKN